MRIIFLDIDGVLNFEGSIWRWNEKNREPYQAVPYDLTGLYGIDQEKVMLLKRVIFETDSKLVLSSTWRKDKQWRDTMEKNGLSKEFFVGETPDLSASGWINRGYEIQAWLNNNLVHRYAIIDDNDDMLPEQMPNFFKTNFKHGLTEDHVVRLIEHLNGHVAEKADAPG